MKIYLKYRFPRKQEKRPSHRKERFSDFFTLALRQAQRPLLCLNRREAERLCSSSTNCCGSVMPVQARSRLSPYAFVVFEELHFANVEFFSFGRSPLRGSGYILWVARFTPFPPNLIKRRHSAAPRGHYP